MEEGCGRVVLGHCPEMVACPRSYVRPTSLPSASPPPRLCYRLRGINIMVLTSCAQLEHVRVQERTKNEAITNVQQLKQAQSELDATTSEGSDAAVEQSAAVTGEAVKSEGSGDVGGGNDDAPGLASPSKPGDDAVAA